MTTAIFEDDAVIYAGDPRVTPDGPGRYVVAAAPVTLYVIATDDMGWLVSPEPVLQSARLGAGLVVGFADADQAIAWALNPASR